MKSLTLLISSLLICCSVSAQEIISTQGDSYAGSYGSIDFTIGEVITATGTDGNNYITQGFQQASWKFVEVEDHEPSYHVSVYPNPMQNVLNIKTSTFDNVTYTMYDGFNRLVLKGDLEGQLTAVQVSKLALGSYSLILNNEMQSLKTFKLIKAQ